MASLQTQVPEAPQVPALTVTEVAIAEVAASQLAGHAIERPAPGSTSDLHSLELEGWVVGAAQPVVGLQLLIPSGSPLRVPVSVERPELHSHFPDLRWTVRSGFRLAMSTVRLDPEFEVRLNAALADGTLVPLATIRGRRRRLPASAARPQPLILTTTGRSGSTWVTELLANHPELEALEPYEYEPRATAYWTEVLATLAEPRSYDQILVPDAHGRDWWIGRGRRMPHVTGVNEPAERWLGTRHVEELARFCADRIDEFYRHAIPADRYARAAYFVEKLWPGTSTPTILRDLYPGVREIVLVRDFRDVACSILAYSRVRGLPLFGLGGVGSDEEYVRGPLLRSARSLLASWRQRATDVLLLRYEDLVRDTRATLHGLLSHAGVDASGDTIEAMIEATPTDRGDHQTSASAAASVGRWRAELGEPERRAFEGEFAAVLEAFGYAQEGSA